jgi:hypothetical protein
VSDGAAIGAPSGAVALGERASAVALPAAPERATSALEIAVKLGAPLVSLPAPAAGDDPEAWGNFTEALKAASGAAKRWNVPLALANRAGTLCPSGPDLKRAAKDVDSSWLRFALDVWSLALLDSSEALLVKTILAIAGIENLESFACEGDPVAATIVRGLRGYRGFVNLDRDDARGGRDAFHHAIARFRAAFARDALERPAVP